MTQYAYLGLKTKIVFFPTNYLKPQLFALTPRKPTSLDLLWCIVALVKAYNKNLNKALSK